MKLGIYGAGELGRKALLLVQCINDGVRCFLLMIYT